MLQPILVFSNLFFSDQKKMFLVKNQNWLQLFAISMCHSGPFCWCESGTQCYYHCATHAVLRTTVHTACHWATLCYDWPGHFHFFVPLGGPVLYHRATQYRATIGPPSATTAWASQWHHVLGHPVARTRTYKVSFGLPFKIR